MPTDRGPTAAPSTRRRVRAPGNDMFPAFTRPPPSPRVRPGRQSKPTARLLRVRVLELDRDVLLTLVVLPLHVHRLDRVLERVVERENLRPRVLVLRRRERRDAPGRPLLVRVHLRVQPDHHD